MLVVCELRTRGPAPRPLLPPDPHAPAPAPAPPVSGVRGSPLGLQVLHRALRIPPSERTPGCPSPPWASPACRPHLRSHCCCMTKLRWRVTLARGLGVSGSWGRQGWNPSGHPGKSRRFPGPRFLCLHLLFGSVELMKPLPGTWSSGRWTWEERRLLNGRAREPEDPAGQGACFSQRKS